MLRTGLYLPTHLLAHACTMDSAGLLASAHGRVLRLLAGRAQRHFEGLGQASRQLKGLPTRLRRKLAHLDIACAYSRHVTEPMIEQFMNEFDVALEAWMIVTTPDRLRISGHGGTVWVTITSPMQSS